MRILLGGDKKHGSHITWEEKSGIQIGTRPATWARWIFLFGLNVMEGRFGVVGGSKINLLKIPIWDWGFELVGG